MKLGYNQEKYSIERGVSMPVDFGSLSTTILGLGPRLWDFTTQLWTRKIDGIIVTRKASAADTHFIKPKVLVIIHNQTGGDIELSHPFFRFRRFFCPVKPHPKWGEHYDTARSAYRCFLHEVGTSEHDKTVLTLRAEGRAQTWIGVDPT